MRQTHCGSEGLTVLQQGECQRAGMGSGALLERFRAKWIPVRVKKMRQNKNLEPRSDSIGTEMALEPGLPLRYASQQARDLVVGERNDAPFSRESREAVACLEVVEVI